MVTATRELSNLKYRDSTGGDIPIEGAARANMKEVSMTAKVIVIALALTAMGGMIALADASKQQAENMNVHAMNLDRCPYYPSPVFCRDASRAHEQDGMGNEADGH